MSVHGVEQDSLHFGSHTWGGAHPFSCRSIPHGLANSLLALLASSLMLLCQHAVEHHSLVAWQEGGAVKNGEKRGRRVLILSTWNEYSCQHDCQSDDAPPPPAAAAAVADDEEEKPSFPLRVASGSFFFLPNDKREKIDFFLRSSK